MKNINLLLIKAYDPKWGGKSIKVPYESKYNIWSLTIAWSISDSLLPLLHEIEEPYKGRIFQLLNLESKLPNFSVDKLKSSTSIEGWEEWLFNQDKISILVALAWRLWPLWGTYTLPMEHLVKFQKL